MLLTGILLSLIAIGYVFAGYPCLMAVLAHFFPRPCSRQVNLESGLSVVICVHNAASVIAGRLRNLLECDWNGPFEVVVVCDGCSDESAGEIERLALPQVRVLSSSHRQGKASALNLAVPSCSYPLVVLTDARQRFAKDSLLKLAAPFADPVVGAVSGRLEIALSKAGSGRGADLYWRLETFLRAVEGRFDSVIGCTGAICAIRRELYMPLPADTLLDDVVIPMRVAEKGYRVIYEPEAVAFDPQKLDAEKEKKRKLRTLVGNFQLIESYPEWMLPWRHRLWWMLVSHKYLRLLVPWLMMVVLLLSLVGAAGGDAFVSALLIGQLLCYAAGLLGLLKQGRKFRYCGIPAGFLLLQACCFLAFFAYFRHRRDLSRLWHSSSLPLQ